MVLAGGINKQIVGRSTPAGGLAVGVCGKDGKHDPPRKVDPHEARPGTTSRGSLDLGFVGEPEKVDSDVIDALHRPRADAGHRAGGRGADGETYNINADTVAGAIAGALGPKRLLMLTDVPGVLDGDKRADREMRLPKSRR